MAGVPIFDSPFYVCLITPYAIFYAHTCMANCGHKNQCMHMKNVPVCQSVHYNIITLKENY